jgi:hypothetical protein
MLVLNYVGHCYIVRRHGTVPIHGDVAILCAGRELLLYCTQAGSRWYTVCKTGAVAILCAGRELLL